MKATALVQFPKESVYVVRSSSPLRHLRETLGPDSMVTTRHSDRKPYTYSPTVWDWKASGTCEVNGSLLVYIMGSLFVYIEGCLLPICAVGGAALRALCSDFTHGTIVSLSSLMC